MTVMGGGETTSGSPEIRSVCTCVHLHDLKKVGLCQVRWVPRAHVLGVCDAPPRIMGDVIGFGELLMSRIQSGSVMWGKEEDVRASRRAREGDRVVWG